MPRRTWWAAAAAALALTVSALAAGSPAHAAPRPGSALGEWQVTQVGPGRYAVAWTSPVRLPVTSDRPSVVGPAAWTIGTSTVADDGRTVRARVDASSRPDPGLLDVELSGRRLDESGGDLARQAATGPDGPLALPGTTTLPVDPAAPGPYAVASSDYELAPVKVPELRQPVEMVGHVVEPAVGAETGPRPLVLFLHGRHGVCYDPSDAEAYSERWPCRAPFREIPSHLGYDYLQRVLASQGYATVSVRVNGVNAQDGALADGGADARARIVQAHLDHWVGLAAAHRVDLSRVVLVGHSRGGEGVDRASIRIPLGAPYRVVGQVLVAPTDFGFQTAPYVPTVTLLPYCDGDVSDLEGQRFTDVARDLTTDDTALRSSVLVMGANHNYFNTEWTPKIAQAPADDDWYGAAGATCGSHDPQRLSATEQQAVGTAYVAGAVHLFASGDEQVLPLFDGSRARVASQGAAQTLSHAIGGGRVQRKPSISTAIALADGAATRFCRGSVVAVRVSACGHGVSRSAAAPMWSDGSWATTPDFFEMSWTAAGQSGGMLLRGPLDLTGRRLELRTIIDNRSGAAVRVRLTDAHGASAVLDPVGGTALPGLGSASDIRKLWAQTVIVDPSATGLDLSAVTRVDLVGVSGSGRLWVADLAAAPARLAAVPAKRLPTLDFSRLRVAEGSGGEKVVRLPFRVNGTVTEPARVVVSTVGQARGDSQRFTVDLAPGQTSGTIPVGYVADDRADYEEVVTQVSGWATRNVMTDRYAGDVTVVDDDPRPHVSVRPVARRVVAGEPVQWEVRLDRRVDYDYSIIAKVVRGPGPQVQVGDIAKRWTELYVGRARPGRPLWKTHAVVYDAIAPGERSFLVSIPTRADHRAEPPETLTMRFVLEGRTVTRTVRLVSG